MVRSGFDHGCRNYYARWAALFASFENEIIHADAMLTRQGDHVVNGPWVGIVEDVMKVATLETTGRSSDNFLERGKMTVADIATYAPYLTVGAPADVRLSSRSHRRTPTDLSSPVPYSHSI